MSLQCRHRGMVCLLAASLCWAAAKPALSQEPVARPIKNKVNPTYPELARRMRIAGIVKVQVTVAPVGSVKNATIIGGHPLLATSVLDAVKKWRFAAEPQETTENLEFHFAPND